MSKRTSTRSDPELAKMPRLPMNIFHFPVVMLLMGYIPILIGISLGLGYLCVWLLGLAMKEPLSTKWSVIITVGVAFVLMSLHIVIACITLYRKPDEKDPFEIELPEQWQTGLSELVKKVAADGDLSVPDSIRLHAASAAHIYQDKRGDTVMVIGGIAIAAFSESALASVVAHELAHAEAGDTKMARITSRWHAFIARIEAFYIRYTWTLCNPITWFVRVYHRVYILCYLADHRICEYAADRISAKVIGREKAAASLVLLHVLEVMPWTRMINVAETAVEMNQKVDQLFKEQVRRLRTLSEAEWAEAFRQAMKPYTTLTHSHPALADRLRMLGVKPKKALNVAQDLVYDETSQRATMLFANWPVVEKYLTKKVMDIVTIAYAERQQFWEDVAAIERALGRY